MSLTISYSGCVSTIRSGLLAVNRHLSNTCSNVPNVPWFYLPVGNQWRDHFKQSVALMGRNTMACSAVSTALPPTLPAAGRYARRQRYRRQRQMTDDYSRQPAKQYWPIRRASNRFTYSVVSFDCCLAKMSNIISCCMTNYEVLRVETRSRDVRTNRMVNNASPSCWIFNFETSNFNVTLVIILHCLYIIRKTSAYTVTLPCRT